MPFKSDPTKVDSNLAKLYSKAADDLAKTGGTSHGWSGTERIAGALILGRLDLLQGTYTDPITAIDRLRDSDDGSWDTVLHLREVGTATYLP